MGLMRVKNEARWLKGALDSITPVCERVYLLDDHSTDDTAKIAIAEPKCSARLSYFDGVDEARDRTWLLGTACSGYFGMNADAIAGPQSPWWFLSIDGDEELVEADREKLTHPQAAHAVSYVARIYYLWDAPDQVRMDGHYATVFRPSFFRYIKPGMVYKNMSGKLHTTGVPGDIGYGKTMHPEGAFRLLHYGYMRKEDRERKFEFYMRMDPVQGEFYRRECLGEGVITKPLKWLLPAGDALK